MLYLERPSPSVPIHKLFFESSNMLNTILGIIELLKFASKSAFISLFKELTLNVSFKDDSTLNKPVLEPSQILSS